MLAPVIGDMTPPIVARRIPIGAIESKIAVHAVCSDWPTVDQRAIAKICGAANRCRMLREGKGTCHGERGR